MALHIRKMRVTDLDGVLEIEVYSFPTPWSRSVYEHDLLKNPNSRFYVAVERVGGELWGYIGNWFVFDECHVGTIATKREARGKGVAQMLLIHTARQAVAENLTYIILEVRVNNLAAINLYKKLGFSQVGLRRGYYRDTGEDGLLLAMRDLSELAARPLPGEEAYGHEAAAV
jgi:ribosomal-protein-alanine N-acetyltransferase